MPKIKLPVIFNQKDSRWGSNVLGFNTDPKYNFYNYACLLCDLTATAKYYGHDIDPVWLNNELKKVLGFTAGSGNYIYNSFTKIFPDIKEVRTQTPTLLTDAQFNDIKNAIDKGYPVIIQLDYDPKDVDLDSHFVTVVGYNPGEENDLTIADPLTGGERSLKDYLGWFKPNARNTIEQYMIMQGTVPAVTADMISITQDHYNLYLRNHDEWHKIVHYLLPDADPNATTFEDCQRVIAGIKSRQSDLESQLKDLTSQLAIANSEIGNRTEQVDRLKQQLLDLAESHKAEITALNSTTSNYIIVRGQYEAKIKELQGTIDEFAKTKGELQNKIASLESQTVDYSKGKNAIQTLIDLIIKTFTFKK